jgi:hypothetical protein
MRWPWEIFMKSKLSQEKEKNEVVAPAREAVQATYKHLNRLDRILTEARKAEVIAMKANARRH